MPSESSRSKPVPLQVSISMFRRLKRLFAKRRHPNALPTDLKTSQPTRVTEPTSAEPMTVSISTTPVVLPRIPQDIIECILDHLATTFSPHPLRRCSIVSKSWVAPCRRHLFRAVHFTSSEDTIRWLLAFPVPEHSPAYHVRNLWLMLTGCSPVPREFFKRIQLFTNLKRINVLNDRGKQSQWMPSLVGLPESVTSLDIDASSITILQLRDAMVQLPNLNNLKLSGALRAGDTNELEGIGRVLRGKFGGRLLFYKLRPASAAEDVVNMLLEVPTGLYFTEIYIDSLDEVLLSTVRLAEACGETLAKLTYSVDDQGEFCLSLPYVRNTDTDAICWAR